MMNNSLKALLLVSALPFAANAADGLSPWYAGAGLGINNYEPNCDQKTMMTCGEDDPYAWDVFGGFLFNEHFGVELGYRDLGRAEWVDYSNVLNDVGARGLSLGLVAFFPIAEKWSLSAEAGAMDYLLYNNKQWGSQYYSDSGIAPYIGAGVGYQLTENLKLQAKYRRYENLDDDAFNTLEMESNYWGLELSYRFGESKKAAPAPAPVPMVKEEPKDSDMDGVFDEQDQCPATPSNHKVDSKGCTIYKDDVSTYTLGSLRFANNSSVINPNSYADIEKLANYMNQHPGSTVEIGGHASNVGNPDYNLKLSDKRAQATAKVLVEKYGIAASRVSAKGYGITMPVMDGNSDEAHAANRRVEAVVTGSEKVAVLK
ncbi:OmpA family protein [Shewanella cyperi]|uniref:OmpA family protein n=1 Tax=Shewanella cyperi TaxID=2814292 RepID=A0A975AL56_9GAMM|nr:OmpA family protein [Shewanella cyperi]QSX30855.1 OmpA family protein [Shewanella cyperi]